MSADWLNLADALTFEKLPMHTICGYRTVRYPNHPAPFRGTALRTSPHLDTRAPGLTPLRGQMRAFLWSLRGYLLRCDPASIDNGISRSNVGIAFSNATATDPENRYEYNRISICTRKDITIRTAKYP
jgi:hypothetical protein